MKGMFTNKNRVVLGILLCLFAVSLIYRITHPYRQPKVDSLTYTGVSSKEGNSTDIQKESGVSPPEESLIELDMFLDPPSHSRTSTKDIFSREYVADNGYMPLDESQIEQISEDVASVADEEPTIEDDLSNFRAFGYMESGAERILFIERGKQIMLIQKGDRIEGKYIVKDITKTKLTLTVIDNNENIYIDLSSL